MTFGDDFPEEVFHILRQEEQTAITLALGHSKSSWEAGEIMGKAHYKYLEIKSRAERFIRLFYSMYKKYDTVLPHSNLVDQSFMEYLDWVIVRRERVKQAGINIGGVYNNREHERSFEICRQIEKLKASNRELEVDLYTMIMEFDRWNNFRILPPELQEPSAFKRRNKVRMLKHLERISSFPEISIQHVINSYTYEGVRPKVYLTLISRYFDDDYRVISMERKSSYIKQLSKSGLYIFNTEKEADYFGEMVSLFLFVSSRTPSQGQTFWPEYRGYIEKAVNFKTVNNIVPTRENYEDAMIDVAKKKVKLKKAAKSSGETRASDGELGIS